MTNDEYLKELASRGDGSLQAWFDAEHVYQNEFVNCGKPYREGGAVLDAGIIRPIRMVDAQSKAQSKTEPTLSEQSKSLSDDLGHPTNMSQKSADCVRNDGKMSETGVSASDVGANDENATCNNSGDFVTDDSREKQAKLLGKKFDQVIFDELQDSREKLEDDVFAAIKRAVGNGSLIGFGIINGWLNRQAAITRKTEQAAWIQHANGLIHEANARADELQAKVDELSELNGSAWQDGFERGCESRDDAIADWRAETDELHEELAKRDKGIARLKRQRDEARQELEKRRWEYCETCEHAELVDRLEAERDALAADLRDCERERERLRQALGTAIDHAHEIMALVYIEGEVA